MRRFSLETGNFRDSRKALFDFKLSFPQKSCFPYYTFQKSVGSAEPKEPTLTTPLHFRGSVIAGSTGIWESVNILEKRDKMKNLRKIPILSEI